MIAHLSHFPDKNKKLTLTNINMSLSVAISPRLYDNSDTDCYDADAWPQPRTHYISEYLTQTEGNSSHFRYIDDDRNLFVAFKNRTNQQNHTYHTP